MAESHTERSKREQTTELVERVIQWSGSSAEITFTEGGVEVMMSLYHGGDFALTAGERVYCVERMAGGRWEVSCNGRKVLPA